MEQIIHQNLWWLDPLAALISGIFGLALWKVRRHGLRMAVLRLLVMARRTFHRSEQRQLPQPSCLGRVALSMMAANGSVGSRATVYRTVPFAQMSAWKEPKLAERGIK